MPGEITSAVFDCNIFIQALLNPDSLASRCIEQVRNGKVKLFVSRDTLAEVRDVVLRPGLLARLPDANPPQIEVFLEDILSVSELVNFVPELFEFQRDPKDEIVINLAIACDAECIVSRDKDLLDLMTGFSNDCKGFRRRFRHLRIVEPLEFFRIIEKKKFP